MHKTIYNSSAFYHLSSHDDFKECFLNFREGLSLKQALLLQNTALPGTVLLKIRAFQETLRSGCIILRKLYQASLVFRSSIFKN